MMFVILTVNLSVRRQFSGWSVKKFPHCVEVSRPSLKGIDITPWASIVTYTSVCPPLHPNYRYDVTSLLVIPTIMPSLAL